MCHQTLIGRSLQAALRCSLLFLLGLVGSFAQAQAPAQEQALTRTARDAQLKWGPCPPFLPKRCGIAVLHGDPAKDPQTSNSNSQAANQPAIKPVVDIPRLINKSPAELDKALGRPIRITKITNDPEMMPGEYRDY